MRGKDVAVDNRPKAWRENKIAGRELQRIFEEPDFAGFRKPLNSPALRMVTRATQASIQPPSSIPSPSPSTGSMPCGAYCIERVAQQVEPPEAFQLEFAEADIFDIAGAHHVGKRADRLIQHEGNRRNAGDLGIGRPIFGIARLLEQLDPRGVERGGKAAGIGFAISAVRIEPHGRAAGNSLLDRLDAPRIVVNALPDLDLERSEAVLEPPLDLFGDVLRGRAV
ncbi:MAG: hypothetical protein WDO24_22690 [Pseudomonadota bacterium]